MVYGQDRRVPCPAVGHTYARPMFRATRAAVVVGALCFTLAGCAATEATSTIPETLGATSSTAGPEAPTPSDASPCLSGDTGFVDRGLVATIGEGIGDATQLSAVGWATHDGCERIVVDFATDDAAPAASLGPTTVRHSPEIGVLNVQLPLELAATAVGDLVMDNAIAERLFVYRDLDGRLNLDIHLAGKAAVRAFTVAGPMRTIIDLRSATDGPPRIGAPTLGPNVVVLAPLPGPIEYPIRIRGYARHLDAELVALLQIGGATQLELTTTTAEPAPAWGAFEIRADAGPTGPVDLRVGIKRGEAIDGVRIPIDVS